MKKVLVVLLSLCMVLGCFSFAFAAEYSDVAADNKYANAIDVLTELGILEGDGTGTFRPADGLKRSEAAVVLVKLLGQGAYAAEQTATKFSDVPASHWASGWIAYAANLGLVEGYGDGKFGPDDQLTYNQWLTMVMRAEGYKDQYLAGDWPTNFIVKASQINLVDSSLVGNSEMSRAEMAQVAYNSLTDEIVSYNLTITGEANEVKGTPGTATSNTFLKKNGVTTVPYAPVPTTATGVLANYVGQTGNAYVKNNKAITFEPAANQVELNGNLTTATSLTLEDKTVYTLAAGTGAVVLKNNGASTAKALVGEDVTVYATVNGTAATYSSIQAWVVTATAQVSANDVKNIAKTTGATATMFGKTFNLTTDGAIDAAKVVVEGAASKLADLKAKDVVSVYDDGAKVTKVVACRDTVHGVVTKITGAGTAAQPYKYTIDGKQYGQATTPTASTVTGTALAVNNTTAGTYYLTKDGELFAYDADQAAAVALNYAVVLANYNAGTTGSVYTAAKNAQIYLMTADGTKKVYDINGDCTFTDAANTTAEAITNLVKDDVVAFALNDAGELVSLKLVADATNSVAAANLTTSGVLDGGLFADNAFIVLKHATDAAKYKVVKLNTIQTGTIAGAIKVVNGDTSKVDVFVVPSAAAATTVQTLIGLFNGSPAQVSNASNVPVQEVSLTVNGATNNYLTKAAGLVPMDAYAHLYVVQFTNGVLTYIDKVEANTTGATAFVDDDPNTTPDEHVDEAYKAVGAVDTYVTVPTDGVQGNLVNYNTADAPDYKNVAGATVYVAKYSASGAFQGWTIGTLADVEVGAKICLYQTSALKTGVDADVIFVVPAAAAAVTGYTDPATL